MARCYGYSPGEPIHSCLSVLSVWQGASSEAGRPTLQVEDGSHAVFSAGTWN